MNSIESRINHPILPLMSSPSGLVSITVWVLLIITVGNLSAAHAAPQGPKRQKVIDFDDELVEGLNRRPLDSLSQLSEKEKRRRKHHLYHKRASFKSETVETLRALRYTP